MKHAHIQTPGLATPATPASWAVISDDLVYLAGHMPMDENGQVVSTDFRAQAHRVFDNLGLTLAAAGSSFENALKINTFLSDLSDFEVYNDVYRKYFGAPFPARTTVQATLYGFRIEVDGIARRAP